MKSHEFGSKLFLLIFYFLHLCQTQLLNALGRKRTKGGVGSKALGYKSAFWQEPLISPTRTLPHEGIGLMVNHHPVSCV